MRCAVVQHRDPVGDAHDHAHLVLDEQDGDAQVVAQPADEARHLGGLGGVHARGRLVEQQQPRLRGERPRDLESTLVAVGQVAGLDVALAARGRRSSSSRSRLGRRPRLSSRAWPACGGPPGSRSWSRCWCSPTSTFSMRGHAAEQPDVLVGPREAEVGDLVGTAAGGSAWPSRTMRPSSIR